MSLNKHLKTDQLSFPGNGDQRLFHIQKAPPNFFSEAFGDAISRIVTDVWHRWMDREQGTGHEGHENG